MSTNARRPRWAALLGGEHRSRWAIAVPAALAVVGGLVVRVLLTRTPLWLDEAQTAAIAGLAPGDIVPALRQDGHPPLYYWLLHGWMRVFGTGDAAVRSLSAVLGAASVVPLAALARRVGGSAAVVPAVALGASSPFLVRYATEARMYSLVALLALGWWLALLRARERPSPGRLAAVAGLVAALLLTQYWSLFLLAAGGAILLRPALRPDGRTDRLVLAAHVAGSLAFVAWLPALFTQLARTGTPWAASPNPATAVVFALVDFAGGPVRSNGLALYAVLVVLVALGIAGRVLEGRRIELDLTGVVAARAVAALVGLTASLGLVVAWINGTAFASRYFAVIVGFVLVLAARGVATVPGPLVRAGVLGLAVALGLVGSWFAVDVDRSQGAEVAAVVGHGGGSGAVVVACPDQLGPAVDRYLEPGIDAVGYPLLEPAGRVDWTDYAERNAAVDPVERAERIVERAGGAPVWLAWQSGYRTLEGQCEVLRTALADRLGPPVEVVTPRSGVFEPMWLTRFGDPG
jgi:mannosyltransferase